MEQVFKVLKQLMGTAGALGGIPKPVKVIMLYFGAVLGVMAILKYANLNQGEKTFLIIAVILLAVITGGYYAWKAWMEKQHNRQFGGDISQHSSATPRAVSDPGQRARLDDMRKKFQSGVEAYKSRGKDLYKLPWYVIVGEPGSGKTEAVRHSNVGFPPGMQDEFQGVGGTINMNWWFTNQAVLLDTAGRLMFEEVKPGETSEWKEFLGLLKKNRPNCPINGLFLVIPADSLIKDSADAIQKKAGKIAQQLDVIQRVLDVRFPVFVAVTKCDKINGFREFFDGLTDPQLQHQMTGWSNPDPLDEPFKPELVDKHLEQVAARLRRRRLGLLRDPVPENPEARRTDEVDSLYALPHSLELLASRLRRYLETIFVAGEWSAKPLFLRGIYFSSSMREGSALDAELAEAIGVAVEELPEGKVWERERAYFLRDLFIEKAFREKGLVTRASNTKHMLRNQQVALYGAGFAALVIFSLFAWFAMRNLHSGGGNAADYWHVVSKAGWDNKYWKQSIVPIRGDGSFVPAINTNVITVENKPITLGQFHAKLRDLAEQPLKKSLIFPGLAGKYNQNSRKSQRIVFEAGVVRPLIEATRQKMARLDQDNASLQRQPDALAALIKLESDILSRGSGPELTRDGATRFLGALQNYVAGQDLVVDTNLAAVMAWTYTSNETTKGWAPRWLGGGRGDNNNLVANRGIDAGLGLFVRSATDSVQSHDADRKKITSLHAAARAFYTNEQLLFGAAADARGVGGEADVRFTQALLAVEKARKDLEAEVGKLSDDPLFAGSGGSAPALLLTNAQHRFRASVTNSAGAALGRVRDVNDAAIALHKDYQLFREIKTRLDAAQAELSTRVTQLLESGDMYEFQLIDENCLADRAFAKRAALYARAGEPAFVNKFVLGLAAQEPLKFKNDISGARSDLVRSIPKHSNEFTRTVDYEIKRAETAFFSNYLAQVTSKLKTDGGFPLVGDTNRMIDPQKFTEAGKLLKYVSDDLASEFFKANAPHDTQLWKNFQKNFQNQQVVARALLGDDANLAYCSISLAPPDGAKDAWRETYRNIKLAFQGGGSEWIRTQSDEKILDNTPVQQKLELSLRRNIDDPPILYRTPEWGPLWLIHKYKGEIDKTDPKRTAFLVAMPVWGTNVTGSVRLKFKFERPLPELEDWAAQ
jgi:hypothetical protein